MCCYFCLKKVIFGFQLEEMFSSGIAFYEQKKDVKTRWIRDNELMGYIEMISEK